MTKLLVSACLIGKRVRYNGTVKMHDSSILEYWQCQRRLVPFCPEVAAGLSVPRPCSEISGGNGSAVLHGQISVMNISGQDVTKYFIDGAKQALKLARSNKIEIAVLKNGSPSCGSTYIYNGSFSNIKRPGRGVATVLLQENGIRVFSEQEIPKASEYLKTLENEAIKSNYL